MMIILAAILFSLFVSVEGLSTKGSLFSRVDNMDNKLPANGVQLKEKLNPAACTYHCLDQYRHSKCKAFAYNPPKKLCQLFPEEAKSGKDVTGWQYHIIAYWFVAYPSGNKTRLCGVERDCVQ